MNIYLLQPYLFKKENLPILMKILKVKQVFDLAHYGYLEEVFYKSEKGSDEIEEAMKAAHICNYRILKPNGEVADIYKESKADNPIYNLEHCNDSNIAILISNVDLAYPFVHAITNNNRICFVRFELTHISNYVTVLREASVYRDGDFHPETSIIPYIKNRISEAELIREEVLDDIKFIEEYDNWFVTHKNDFVQPNEGFTHHTF